MAAGAQGMGTRAERIGRALRRALGDWPPPAIVVQSHGSLLRGSAGIAAWGRALAAFHGDQRANEDADRPWAILADHGDLPMLPAAVRTWGGHRVVPGLTLPLVAQGDADDVHDQAPLAVVVARDAVAYAQLCRLASWRHEAPRAWQAFLAGALPPQRAPVDWAPLVVLVDQAPWAERFLTTGARVCWRSGVVPRLMPDALIQRGVLAVAAPICRWLDEAEQAQAPLLQAVRSGTTLGHGAQRGGPGRSPLTTLAAIARMRHTYVGHTESWRRGRALVRGAAVFAGHDPDRPRWYVPPLPPQWRRAAAVDADTDIDAVLRAQAEAGIPWRYGDRPPATLPQRLAHELEVIRRTRFAGYILTVWDLARGRLTCGRGSGASSLVCYLLGITNVDPIRYQLLFERFLMVDRSDPPDIDVDFPWDERDEIFLTALRRHGREHVAMVATHQHLQRWAAIREAARAHGLDDGAITAARSAMQRQEAFRISGELPAGWHDILAAADAISGAPRHIGLHCGGLVITEEPIRTLAPVHPAAKQVGGTGMPALAWEKDGVEDMGLVKIDILGNRSLAVIRDCLADLAEDGIAIPRRVWLHPDTDEPTREVVARGDTMGCFYIESPAMRQLQRKAASADFDRLVVHSSIIRPAAATYIDRYLERLHAWYATGEQDPAWYPHPSLANLLSESFGVMSYQEDVMLVCQAIAGFSDQEANRMRKLLGSWGGVDDARVRAMRARFEQGCRAGGIADTVRDEVWTMIESFTGYSFCKAHSASYAMVSYQCAYLKTHHPAHFLARVISNGGGFYHAAAYIEEARRWGVRIRAPCVCASDAATVRAGADALRIGLHLIDGIGQTAITRLLAARDRAPFASLSDLRHRAGLEVDELQALLHAGALDGLLPASTAAQRAWLVAAVARGTAPQRESAQLRLDDLLAPAGADAGAGPGADPRAPTLPPIDPHLLATRQRAALGGILPGHHPLLLLRLPHRRWRCADITADTVGRRVQLIAHCIASRSVTAHYSHDRGGDEAATETSAPMGFVTLEDETGLVETVWFPESYRRFGMLIRADAVLAVRGQVEAPFGSPALHVEHVQEFRADGRGRRQSRPSQARLTSPGR